MLSILAEGLGILGAVALSFAPGLLVVMCLPRGTLPPRMTVSAALILSPGVIAIELVVAILAGLPFALFAPIAAAANLVAAGILLLHSRPQLDFNIPLGWLVAALLIFIPFAAIVFDVPMRRAYGWHNMQQIEIIHSIYALPKLPEDFGLAGTSLGYGWLGWAQLATIAKLVDEAPTVLFVPLNLVQFVALFIVLCEATALLVRRSSNFLIAVIVGAILLSPGLIDLAIAFVGANHRPFEPRITPLVSKYLNMDLMAPGLSAMALTVYAIIRAALSRHPGSAILAPLTALAACLVYPLHFPFFILLAGAHVVAMLFGPAFPRWRLAQYTRAESGIVAATWAMCIALTATYLVMLGRDAMSSHLDLYALADGPARIKLLLRLFLAVDGLLLLALYMAWKERSGIAMLLIAVAIPLQAAFLLFHMPLRVEYKFLYASMIVSLPAMAAAALAWAAARQARRIAAIGAFATLLAAVLIVTPRWHLPGAVALADAVDESGAELREKELTSWLQAVRDQTPEDAVLLSGASNQPIAVFARRALYVCVDKDELTRHGYGRHGYGMSCWLEYKVMKRYDADKIVHRRHILKQAVADRIDPAEALKVLDALQQLSRPFILHTRGGSGFQTWLNDNRIGRAIFNSATDTVWLVDRADLEKAHAGRLSAH